VARHTVVGIVVAVILLCCIWIRVLVWVGLTVTALTVATIVVVIVLCDWSAELSLVLVLGALTAMVGRYFQCFVWFCRLSTLLLRSMTVIEWKRIGRIVIPANILKKGCLIVKMKRLCVNGLTAPLSV